MPKRLHLFGCCASLGAKPSETACRRRRSLPGRVLLLRSDSHPASGAVGAWIHRGYLRRGSTFSCRLGHLRRRASLGRDTPHAACRDLLRKTASESRGRGVVRRAREIPRRGKKTCGGASGVSSLEGHGNFPPPGFLS